MRLDFWNRKPSVYELEAAERKGAERYAKHVGLAELRQTIEDLRAENEALKEGIAMLTGTSAPELTPIVATPDGDFVRVG